MLLQCRRDDLKKLWIENVETKCICTILQQIEEIKALDSTFSVAINGKKYKASVDILKKGDIILNGPLSAVNGLDDLRLHVTELTSVLFEKVVNELLEILVLKPFESQVSLTL